MKISQIARLLYQMDTHRIRLWWCRKFHKEHLYKSDDGKSLECDWCLLSHPIKFLPSE